MQENNIYYDYQKILSYNAMLNFLNGERGVGKTFGAKKFVIKDFLKRNSEFAYIRRYDNELRKALPKSPDFFQDITDNKCFPEHNLYTKSRKFYCDDKCFGYAMRLTEAQDLKGTTFTKVNTIIFDEYIIEKSRRQYLPNEVNIFLGVIESLARMRDIRVFFLGNSVTATNPYFLYFDLSVPYNSDIKTFKNGLILVQQMKNEEYRKAKSNTRFGKLVAGTPYENYAINNQFILDNKNFIEKKKGTSKFSFAFIYEGNTYGVWNDFIEGKIYISNDFIKNTPYIFSTTLTDHSENTMFLNSAKKYNCWKNLIENFNLGNLRFENIKIKNITQELIKRLLIH